jgi:hypothetical protein
MASTSTPGEATARPTSSFSEATFSRVGIEDQDAHGDLRFIERLHA